MTELSARDPANIYAMALAACNEQDWPRARTLARHLLETGSAQAGVCYIIGFASMQLGQLPVAAEFLRRACEMEPTRAKFVVHYADVLWRWGRRRESLMAAGRAMHLAPADPTLQFTLGIIYALARSHADAASCFRRCVESAPTHADAHYYLAVCLVALGDIDGAEDELECCLAQCQTHWKAHHYLSDLRRQTRDSNHLARLHSLLDSTAQQAVYGEATVHLNAALAKEYEDLGSYDDAFTHLAAAKKQAGASKAYVAADDERLFNKIIEVSRATPHTEAGYACRKPIFIIGMPRSGTTLIDRILSSHPEVFSAGELINFPVALKRASGSRTPGLFDEDVIARSRGIDWRVLGREYIASTQPETDAKQYFIDKLPHNFLYAGAISKALPDAKIICLRRGSMDTCLSNFKQMFPENSPFFGYANDIVNTGRYYILFDRLMKHWKEIYPDRIFEVEYEQIVLEQERYTRILLDYCGLEWNDACLNFHGNPNPVSSASAIQVRQPMYTSSIKRWEKYGANLHSLQQLLASEGIDLDAPERPSSG